ncbi:MAG TPA: hypothetical protein ENK18_03765 [Deltaproteobacteria bacterium]|nr:hypothetical protein [Deltaproteobacteria bacterium]
MLDELQPLSLTAAARRLGIDPFEVVRLLVVADAVPKGPFALAPELVQRLGELGRIEPPWWEGVALPNGEGHPGLKRIRAALGLLLSRGHTAERPTRLDNVWRGLEHTEQELLSRALHTLAEASLLSIEVTPIGQLVCVRDEARERVQAIAEGSDIPDSLTAAVEG